MTDIKFFYIIFIILSLDLFILGCNDGKQSSGSAVIKGGEKVDSVKTVIIDGCKYIDNECTGNGHIYTHMGSCNNHIYK